MSANTARREDLPEPIWSGTFTMFGYEIRCHVLSNGQRVIEADSAQALLEGMGTPDFEGDVEAFARWLSAGPVRE